jgi:hypothetical protein
MLQNQLIASPKNTWVSSFLKFVPVIVIKVPPFSDPEIGEIS